MARRLGVEGLRFINLCRIYYARMKAAAGRRHHQQQYRQWGAISDPQYIADAMGNVSLMALTRASGGSRSTEVSRP